MLQLVTDSQAASVRRALEDLIAEFRQVARALVHQMEVCAAPVSSGDPDYPKTVRCFNATWCLDPHGEHCRFDNLVSGQVVEANIHARETVDPYFLLLYAETPGRHGAVVDACTEGFHDMCRLLELADITTG